MAYLLERDALSGKAGRAFCTIDGRQVELFGLRNLQLDFSLNTADFACVGTRLVQKKTTGVELTGKMTIYYGTPEWANLVQRFLLTGQLPYFTLQVTNDDPASSVGAQTIVLYDVKLESGALAKLDSEADFLDNEISFSFASFAILRAFQQPERLGIV